MGVNANKRKTSEGASSDETCAKKAKKVTVPAPVEEKKESKNRISQKRFLEKWKAQPPPKPTEAMLNKGWCVRDGAVYERCVQCSVEKMRTTDNFTAKNVKGGIEEWFAKNASGCESLQNSPGHACNVCYAGKMAVKDNDMVGDGYIRIMMMKYPQLHEVLTAEERASYKQANPTCCNLPTTDRGVRYYQAQLELECHVTGGTVMYAREKGHPLVLTMNRMDVRAPDEPVDNGQNHTHKNTRGAYYFTNVVQGQTNWRTGLYTPYITDLSAEWTETWRDVAANYMKTAQELFDEEKAAIAAPEQPVIIGSMANRARNNDAAKNRENDMPTERLRECLHECRMRCHTSHLLMEVKSGARKVHMDRILDAVGHIRPNVEFKIHLFSNPAKISRKLFLQIFLSQRRVPLSDEVRAKALKDIAALP